MDEPGFGKAPPPEKKKAGPLFGIDGVKFHALPIMVTILLCFGIPVLAEVLILIVQRFVPLRDLPLYPWIERYYEYGSQLALAWFAISLMKPLVRADYGLHRPRGKSYIAPALFWGALLGVLMTGADFAREIAAHRAPSGAYELTPVSIAGWLSFQGGFLGLSDEMLYRGLLVTYLAATLPGRIVLFRRDTSLAGIIVALMFALTFIGGFFAYPFGIALARMLVVFVQGIFFAYWFQKSKSLVAPVVGHGACFGVYQNPDFCDGCGVGGVSDPKSARFRFVPFITALLGFALPILAANAAVLASHFFGMPSPKGPPLPWLYSQHPFQLLFALVAIGMGPILRAGGLRSASAARQDLHPACDPLGRVLRRADDGGGLRAANDRAYETACRLPAECSQRGRLALLRRRLCGANGRDSLPCAAGDLPRCRHAGKSAGIGRFE